MDCINSYFMQNEAEFTGVIMHSTPIHMYVINYHHNGGFSSGDSNLQIPGMNMQGSAFSVVMVDFTLCHYSVIRDNHRNSVP